MRKQKKVYKTTISQSFVITVFFALFMFISSAFSMAAESDMVKLRSGKGRLSLEFGTQENGFSLDNLNDSGARRNLIAPGRPLWSIELEHKSGKKITLTNTQCRNATFKQLSPSEAVITWLLDEAIEDASDISRIPRTNFLAQCTVKLDGTGARLKLRIYNHSSEWSIREVTFPELELVQLGKSDKNDALVFPFAAGRVVKRPLKTDFDFGGVQVNPSRDRNGLYANPWTNMQFCAYWDEDGGLYIAAEDPFASAKYLIGRRTDDGSGISVKIVWPAADAGIYGNDFEHPGFIALELFDGDWFDAAQIYRRWAKTNAHWWPAVGQEGRIDTPRWMKETAVWVIASLSPEAIEQTVQFAEFMGVPTAIHLYNWHQVPFDNDYPHYFPVKDGFREGVKQLHDAGVRVMPYINARLWDNDTEDFLSFALPAATKKENGEYYIETYGSKEELVPMCPVTALWKNTVKNIIMRLVGPGLDVDGVYLDQVSAMSPVLCYDPSHGHPLGGGHWWTTDGYWPMMESLQKTLAAEYPEKILTSECNAEPYIHCFDGYLTWHFQFNDMVPLFSAVYGGTIQQFGRAYSGNDQTAHRMRIGQSLVFGEQLGWINPRILKEKETAEFLRSAAKVRFALLPFLSSGEMARPPELHGSIPDITAEWAWAHEERNVTYSAVQSGAWKSPDGRIAFIFANVSENEVTFQWHLDTSRYGFGKQTVTVEQLNSGLEKRTLKGGKDIPLQLAGKEIAVFIVSPVK